MHAVCKEHDILFVADEVITGFGRVGPLFACEEDDVVRTHDYGKGIDFGLCADGGRPYVRPRLQHVADGAGKTAVGHGYTYSAHPVSAAVGLAWRDTGVDQYPSPVYGPKKMTLTIAI